MIKKNLSLFGSTGSVGKQVVELIKNFYFDYYNVKTLSCKENYQLVAQQAIDLNAQNIIIANHENYTKLKNLVSGSGINVFVASEFPQNLIILNDLIVIGIVGIEALKILYTAISNGIKVATSNKESIICGGGLLHQYREHIIPLDSEHHSIARLISQNKIQEIKEIILTATGGPFFKKDKSNILVKDALKHPIWAMGKKNCIDSATMMNKVFEVIEAHHLFGIPKENISILIHPEAFIHGMVKMADGTLHAFISSPDMKIGINAALASFIKNKNNKKEFYDNLNFCGKSMNFASAEATEFPALKLLNTEQEITLSAADDVAVEAFLSGHISFGGITQAVAETLDTFRYNTDSIKSIDDVLNIYKYATEIATQVVFSSTCKKMGHI